MATVPVTFAKKPDWSRLYRFNFAQFAELALDAETIASATVTLVAGSDGALTIGTPSIVGTRVFFLLSGGTLGQTYELLCTATTSGGHTISQTGYVQMVPTT